MMKKLIELFVIGLLMAVFMLLIFVIFVWMAIATPVERDAPCGQQVYEDVQEQIRNETMIQGGLLCR